MCVYAYIYIYVYTYICIYICIHEYTHACIYMCICANIYIIYIQREIFESKYDHTNTKHGKGGGGVRVQHFNMSTLQYSQHSNICISIPSTFSTFQHFPYYTRSQHFNIEIINISTLNSTFKVEDDKYNVSRVSTPQTPISRPGGMPSWY